VVFLNEIDKIIEKIDSYLQSKKLPIEHKYFVTKRLNESYWAEILGEEEEEELEEELEDLDFEEEESEDPYMEMAAETEDLTPPKPLEETEKPKSHKKGIGLMLKKAKGSLKK